MGTQLMEPGACMDTAGTKNQMGVSLLRLSMHRPISEMLRDIAKEMRNGDEQRDLGVYFAAAAHYKNARQLAKGLTDKQHLADASQNLAAVWLIQGKLMDALDELLATMAVTRTASLVHVSGNVYREMGQMGRALQFYEEARGFESKSPNVLLDMCETYVRLGSFDTAAKNVQEALEYLEQESLEAARAHSLDGLIHLSRGNASGGLQRLTRALSIQTKRLHTGHPDLVSTQMNQALAMRDIGSADEALAAAESVERSLRNSTSEDLQLSRALTQKAEFLSELGRFADAEEAMKEVFMLQTQIFEHQAVPEVARALGIYGSILHGKGDLSQAKYQYFQALEMNLDTVGTFHPETAAAYNNLGTLWQDKGNLAKAARHFERCLDIQIKTLGESNPDVASTYNNLATVAAQQGLHADAEAHLQKALSVLDAAQVPEKSPDRLAYMVNLEDLKKMKFV